MSLEVRGLSLELPRTSGSGKFFALRGLDLDVPATEVAALIGPSAAGKSLLALALLGLCPPGGRISADRVVLAGEPLDLSKPDPWAGLRGTRIAWLPQDAAASLDPCARVGAHLTRVLRAHGRLAGTAPVEAALTEAGLDPSVAGLHPHALSGGMAQRVALAVALALAPSVYVLDEPTSALDSATAEAVLAAVLSRASRGASVVLVTHDLSLAWAHAHQITVLAGGRVVERGCPADWATPSSPSDDGPARREQSAPVDGPRHPVTRALIAGRPVPPEDLEAPSGS